MTTRDQMLLQIAHLLIEENGPSARDIVLRPGSAQGPVCRTHLATMSGITLTTARRTCSQDWMPAEGLREKSGGVADVVISNDQFVREAHRGALDALHGMAGHGARGVDVHAGASITEIAATSLCEHRERFVAVADDGFTGDTQCGAPLATLRERRQSRDSVLRVTPRERRVHFRLHSTLVVAPVEHESRGAP